ncbi:unnamed protein product [Vicia faba]|uniref:Uncharacterized protein n=1 Tax=Vicia faba TaxID=3906 RepID=A0AAV1AQA6_VICFA|nr:unnamed protein product [Vicia faba]
MDIFFCSHGCLLGLPNTRGIDEGEFILMKDKLWINRENLRFQLSEVMAAVSRNTSLQTEEVNAKMLSSRIDNPVSKFSGFCQGLGRSEQIQNQDVSFEKSFKLP